MCIRDSFYLDQRLDEPLFSLSGQVGGRMIGVGRLANDSSLGVGDEGEELGHAGLLT